jgi:hypothetical protein
MIIAVLLSSKMLRGSVMNPAASVLNLCSKPNALRLYPFSARNSCNFTDPTGSAATTVSSNKQNVPCGCVASRTPSSNITLARH